MAKKTLIHILSVLFLASTPKLVNNVLAQDRNVVLAQEKTNEERVLDFMKIIKTIGKKVSSRGYELNLEHPEFGSFDVDVYHGGVIYRPDIKKYTQRQSVIIKAYYPRTRVLKYYADFKMKSQNDSEENDELFKLGNLKGFFKIEGIDEPRKLKAQLNMYDPSSGAMNISKERVVLRLIGEDSEKEVNPENIFGQDINSTGIYNIGVYRQRDYMLLIENIPKIAKDLGYNY